VYSVISDSDTQITEVPKQVRKTAEDLNLLHIFPNV